jgi:hypothetical protein
LLISALEALRTVPPIALRDSYELGIEEEVSEGVVELRMALNAELLLMLSAVLVRELPGEDPIPGGFLRG